MQTNCPSAPERTSDPCDIVVFGDVEEQSKAAGRDIVVVVRGPDSVLTVRRRDQVAGVWINHDAASLTGMPFFYYENTDGGHAASANLKERAKRQALEFTYLKRQLMD